MSSGSTPSVLAGSGCDRYGCRPIGICGALGTRCLAGQKNGATRLGGTARPPCSRERARNPQTNRWRGAGPDAASCVPAERCGCTSVARAPQPCPEQAVYLSRIVSAHAKVGAGRPIGLVVLRRLSLSGPTREVRTAPNGARGGYGTSRQQNLRTASCRDSSGYGSGTSDFTRGPAAEPRGDSRRGDALPC